MGTKTRQESNPVCRSVPAKSAKATATLLMIINSILEISVYWILCTKQTRELPVRGKPKKRARGKVSFTNQWAAGGAVKNEEGT